MTAPNYELYRVVTDYEALVDGFADRIEDLNAPLTEIDEAGGLTRGNMQKLLKSANPEDWRPSAQRKQSRAFGWETLGKALKGTGMALVLVIDDDRFAPVKEQLGRRKRVREHPKGSSTRPTWLFTRKMSRKMQALRASKLSPKQREKIARKAGVASGKARRAKARMNRQSGVEKVRDKIDDVNLVSASALRAPKACVDIRNERRDAGMLASAAE